MATSAFAVEVITLPVNDVDRALRFSVDQIGFALDVDWRPREDFAGGFARGLDPGRGDYPSFADFAEPDGNTWVLQERGFRQTPEQR
jgi:catechol 2,3-dioxygenase-like lactoylglutathione lyase family enzyme